MTANTEEQKKELATFAGGCFWCMEGPYDKLDGVHETISGYTGGEKANPTYKEVSAGSTSHAEAVQVSYDPAEVNYSQLLDVFWHNIDPTQENGQFADKGMQYRTAIFYHNEEQRTLAEESKKKLEESGRFKKPIVTEIIPASAFYKAEDYHQDYYLKNPTHYNLYRIGSGRAGFLKKVWGSEK